jgi:hypothetical protein
MRKKSKNWWPSSAAMLHQRKVQPENPAAVVTSMNGFCKY